MEKWLKVVEEFVLLNFGPFNTDWYRQTRYCGVALVDASGKKFVIKVVMPNEPPNERKAKYLNEASEYFRTQLRQLGIPLASNYEYFVWQGYALQVSTYEGVDGEALLKQNPNLVAEVVPEVIKAASGVLNQGPDPIVGLDGRLSNFCFTGQSIVYIDTFPPLCQFRGETLVHYPNPTDSGQIEQELQRKFEPLGILRRLRFSVLALNPAWSSVFDQALTHLEPRLQRQAEKFFASIPNGSIKSLGRKEILALVDGLAVTDVDARREIAALVIPPGHERAALLEQIFCLTTLVPVEGFDPLPERLKKFRAIISDRL